MKYTPKTRSQSIKIKVITTYVFFAQNINNSLYWVRKQYESTLYNTYLSLLSNGTTNTKTWILFETFISI